MEIMKGDKLGRHGGSGSQEPPRMEITKGDKVGREGGSGSRETSLEDKVADAAKSSPKWKS